jgi:hypothetical protein
VTIPPEVLARYNAVNARAEETAKQPFQPYSGEFVAPLTPTQQAGVQATSAYSQTAQPFYGAGAGLTLGAAQPVGPLTQGQIGYYQNPYTQAVVGSTLGALGQQFGQQQAQQQAEAIKAGAFGGDRSGIQRAQLMGQQGLAAAQAIAPLYQQGYQQAVQTAQGQQGVIASDLARQLQAGQQIAALGTGAQQAALQGAQAQIGAGTLQQQTQQAQDTAQYQQFLQERGYPFQVAQFLANIAEGTGALSGSTTTTTQPSSFFSDRRLKHDAEKIGETKDGLPIYSFKYNGDDRTQIGLMAQDVEKKHPEAVGLSGGYKTVDYEKALHPSKKAYGGGLDPNSMGGVVSEPGAFYRGGYATAGAVVDPTDLSAILQQQRQAFGPFAAAGLYGQAAGAAPHGASGIVPQQQMHVPKLITAGAAPRPTDSGFSDVYKGYQGLNQIADDMTGKSLTRRFGEKTGLTQTPEAKAELTGGILPSGASATATGDVNPASAVPPMPTPRDPTATSGGGLWDSVSNFFGGKKSEGGGIMPRHHYEAGGASVNPYAQRDPTEGYIDDTIQEEDKTKTPDMLKPGGGIGGKSGGIGSDLMGAAGLIGAGKTLMSGGSWLMDALPAILAVKNGGVIPRQHFATRGAASSGDDASASSAPVYSDDQLDQYARAALPFIAGRESGGEQDPYAARNPQSSAAGKFQFTDDTGKSVLARHPEIAQDINYDPTKKGFVASLPAEVQDAMGHAHAKDQAVLLARNGFEPTPLNIYMNHFLGEAGGPNFLRRMMQDPTAPAYSLVSSGAANANQNIFFDKQGNPRTAAQVYDIMGGKAPAGGLGGARAYASAQPTTMTDGRDTGFFESNKQYILPLLQGLGAMAGSKSRYLGSALLEGLGAGAKAYGDVERQQADIGEVKQRTASEQAVTASNWIAAAKSSSYLKGDGRAYVLTPKGEVLLSVYNQNPAQWGEPMAQPQMRAALEKQPASPSITPNIYGEEVKAGPKTGAVSGAVSTVSDVVQPQHIASTEPKFVSGAPTPYTLIGKNADQNIEVDKQRAMVQPANELKANFEDSMAQVKAINQEAKQASDVASQFDKLAESAMRLPETGSMSQGAFLEMKTRWADYVNSILKTSNVDPEYWISDKDVGTVQGMKKIENALRLNLGSKSIDALQTAMGAIPNANMSRAGFIEAYAPERVRMQQAMDRARYVEDYRRAYDKKYGTSFSGGWSAANAVRSFNDDNPQHQYDTDVARMKFLMSKKANPETGETYWSAYKSGKVPRHFSDRQTGGVGYRRYFEGYGQ